ncbi:MAG: hypothetical protein EA377_01890 [Phycisphaerales bacterium]|nr:MAG: hypothetical protein EA377_01890 [Phycisphaerales bacterium]
MYVKTNADRLWFRSVCHYRCQIIRSTVAAALLLCAGPALAQSICTTDCSNHPNVPAGTSCLSGLSNSSGLVSYPGAGVAPCTASGTYTVWHATRFDVPASEVTEITHLCIGTLATSVAGVAIYDATVSPNQPTSSFPLPTGLWGPFAPPVNNVGNTVLIEVAPTTAPLQVTGPFWVVVGYNNVGSATQTQGVTQVTATQGASQTPPLPAKSMMAVGDVCSLCAPPSIPTCQTWVDYNDLPVFQYTDRAPEIRPLRFGVAATCPPFSSYSQDCCDFVCVTDPTCCGSWHPACFDLANANCPTPCVTYIPPSGIYGEIESCGQNTNDTCSTAELVDCDAGAILGTTFLEINQSVSPPVVTKDVDWYAVDLTDLNGSGMANLSLHVITEIPLIVEVFAADPNNCQINQVPQFGGFVPVNCGPGGHHIPGNVGFSPGQTVERFYIRVEPANVPLEGPCSHRYTIHFAPTQCQPGSVCTTATNDCYTIGGPGCNDTACCQDVCACDPFCCNNQWDSLCVGPVGAAPGCSAIELCSDCGDPAAGDCCAPLGNGTPGCNDFNCCAEVCAADSACCDIEWDAPCATLAQALCNICPPSSCVTCPASAIQACGGCGTGQCGGCTTGTGWETAQCGDVFCGELEADAGTADEHWYELNVPAVVVGFAQVILDVESDMPLIVEIHDNTCSQPFPVIIQSMQVPACTPTQVGAGVPAPGAVHIVVRPDVSAGHPCGTDNTYTMHVDIVDPNSGQSCPTGGPGGCISCPPGSVQSCGPCGVNQCDGCVNGLFEPIDCGITHCGELFADGSGVVDEDWYTLNVPFLNGPADVLITVAADMDVEVAIHVAGCPATVLNSIPVPACTPTQLVEAVPTPVDLDIVVRPAVVGGHPCGTANAYTLHVEVVDHVTGTVCPSSANCVTCPAGALATCGPCGGHNCGGCITGDFAIAECGETHCGELFAFGGTIDEHWYELEVPNVGGGFAEVLLVIEADMDINVQIHEDTCGGNVLDDVDFAACSMTSYTIVVAADDTYHIRIAPSAISGLPCGTTNNYTMYLEIINPVTGDVCPPSCCWNLTGSGTVNVFTLLQLLSMWGQPCPCGPSSTCNVFSLLNLLANWGPCP